MRDADWINRHRREGEFAAFDAEKVFDVAAQDTDAPAECISAQVLQGLKKPVDCPAFGVRCTPENPLGAPMVSSEGACAAYHRYRNWSGVAGRVALVT